VLVVATVGYIVVGAHLALRNHDGFGTLGYDFGNFDQGVWLLSRLHRPFVTIMGRHLFGDHLSFVLLPFAPVYRAVPTGKVLLVAQSCALGLSAVPVFLIGREKLRHELLAAAVAVGFLAHPALAWTNFDQFHPDAFEVPLLLFALWFMLTQRWVPHVLCVAGLLLVKEDVGLLTVGLGVYVALRHHRWIGLLTAAVSAAYVAIAFAVVKPGLGVASGLNIGRVPFGGFGGLARTAVTRPWDVGRYLTEDGRPFWAWQLVASFGLVPLLGPELLAVALGPFAFNLLSTYVYQHRIRYHYATLLLPVMVVAAIFGVARVAGVWRRALLVSVLVTSSLVCGYLWGPMPGGPNEAFVGDPAGSFVRDARAAIALVPPDASVSAFYPFTTHLTHRIQVYEFPNPFAAHWWGSGRQEGQRLPEADGVEFVVLPKAPGYWTPEFSAVLESLRPEFDTAFDSENVVLLLRRRP